MFIAKLILLYCSSKELRWFFPGSAQAKILFKWYLEHQMNQVWLPAVHENEMLIFTIADEVKHATNHDFSACGNWQDSVRLWIYIWRDKWYFRAQDNDTCVYQH